MARGSKYAVTKPPQRVSRAATMSLEDLPAAGAEGGEYDGHDEAEQLLSRGGESFYSADRREVRVQPYVRVMFMLLGAGCLTPWNSLAGAVDFIGALLPHCDPPDAFAVANFSANLLFLVIQLRFCKCFSGRAIVGLVVYIFVLLYPLWLAWEFQAPIDHDYALEAQLFAALVAGVALAGAAGAGLQVVCLSLAGQMGSECTAAFMNGQAVAGIITSVCRILSKLLFEDRQPFEALRQSSILYFGSSVTVVAVCIWSWFSLARLPETKEARFSMSRPQSLSSSRRESAGSPGMVPLDLSELSSEALLARMQEDGDMVIDDPPDWQEDQGGIMAAWKRVWLAALGVMSVFGVTLAVFPGVVTRIPSVGTDARNWMPVVLIATFNVGDLAGRYTAGVVDGFVSAKTLGLMIVLRTCLVPLLIFQQIHPGRFGDTHDAQAVCAVLVLASSNGLCASLTLMKGQRLVLPGQQNETASTILALTMCLGLVLGALTALPISSLTAQFSPAPSPP